MQLNASPQLHHCKNNESLCDYVLCDDPGITCVFQICSHCQGYPKLDDIRDHIIMLKCSKDCMQKNINCFEANHTVKVRQNYLSQQGQISLVDNHDQLDEVV